jgi:hypothetical protein
VTLTTFNEQVRKSLEPLSGDDPIPPFVEPLVQKLRLLALIRPAVARLMELQIDEALARGPVGAEGMATEGCAVPRQQVER